jgi:hypothetical protein
MIGLIINIRVYIPLENEELAVDDLKSDLEKEIERALENITNPGKFPYYDFILLPNKATIFEYNLVVCTNFILKK